MPYKPKKPCAYPGCPNLTDKKYCKEHERLENKRYDRYQRDPAHKKRYGRTWQKIRARYVKLHPFCEMCLKEGKIVPVEQVHHKAMLKIPENMTGVVEEIELFKRVAGDHLAYVDEDGNIISSEHSVIEDL